MTPSIGRIVHYVSYGTPGGEFPKACRAAIVTEVELGTPRSLGGERIGLCVLNPTGMFFHSLADGGCKEDDGQGVPGDPTARSKTAMVVRCGTAPAAGPSPRSSAAPGTGPSASRASKIDS